MVSGRKVSKERKGTPPARKSAEKTDSDCSLTVKLMELNNLHYFTTVKEYYEICSSSHLNRLLS